VSVLLFAVGLAASGTAPAQLIQPLPDDIELEHQHARIGRISIQVDDVFEHELRAKAYQLVNALHIATRSDTISEQLLFHSGDIYQRRVLDETERLLRAQRYLNAASIEPVSYNSDNTVDVIVRVHEVWTLSPGFSFGRKGGANSTNVELEDSNFLGLGKHVAIARSGDTDRSAWRLSYADPNLLGSWWQLSAGHAQLSDGSDTSLSITRPFESLDARHSFRVAGVDTRSEDAHYVLGLPVDRFETHREAFEIGGGISDGVIAGRALRYLGGFRYQSRDFSAVAGAPQTTLPTDRVLSYPWLGVEWLEDEYIETHNLDQIGRTEDVYLGRKAHVEIGAASTAFGATRDAMLANGEFQAGLKFGEDHYAIGTLGFNGRYEGGEIRNALVDLGFRYYLRQSQYSVLFASLNTAKAMRLDPEEQLLLGGDNGLRGYPLRFQAGTARALFTLEERFYTNWQPFKLANVGAAVFFDAGRMWGDDPVAGAPVGWVKDVGVGLRLGNARTGLGNVLHIDLAFPLDRDKAVGRTIDSMQLLIETSRSF